MRFTDAPLARLPRWLALTPLLVLAIVTPMSALGADVWGGGGIEQPSLETVALSSPVLNVAIQAVGTYEGECFPWVRRVIASATGRGLPCCGSRCIRRPGPAFTSTIMPRCSRNG